MAESSSPWAGTPVEIDTSGSNRVWQVRSANFGHRTNMSWAANIAPAETRTGRPYIGTVFLVFGSESQPAATASLYYFGVDARFEPQSKFGQALADLMSGRLPDVGGADWALGGEHLDDVDVGLNGEEASSSVSSPSSSSSSSAGSGGKKDDNEEEDLYWFRAPGTGKWIYSGDGNPKADPDGKKYDNSGFYIPYGDEDWEEMAGKMGPIVLWLKGGVTEVQAQGVAALTDWMSDRVKR